MDLIDLQLLQCEKKSPKFNKVHMEVFLKFGNLYIHFKPDSLLSILEFISMPKNPNDK